MIAWAPEDGYQQRLMPRSGYLLESRRGGIRRVVEWLVWGVITAPVSVSLADGTDVPIVTCGPLWAAEWVSLPTQAFVMYAGRRHLVLRHLRPLYLPPAPFPSALANQSRSSDGGHAWFSFGRPPPGAIDISQRGAQ